MHGFCECSRRDVTLRYCPVRLKHHFGYWTLDVACRGGLGSMIYLTVAWGLENGMKG